MTRIKARNAHLTCHLDSLATELGTGVLEILDALNSRGLVGDDDYKECELFYDQLCAEEVAVEDE